MKNKTLRTNSMKLKKVIAAFLAISVLFAFTGCGNSSTTDNTNTKTGIFFHNRQYKHKTGIFFHNRNGQRRRAERKTG